MINWPSFVPSLAGTSNTSTTAVDPTDTDPCAVLQNFRKTFAVFGLIILTPSRFPAPAFTATAVLLSAVFLYWEIPSAPVPAVGDGRVPSVARFTGTEAAVAAAPREG